MLISITENVLLCEFIFTYMLTFDRATEFLNEVSEVVDTVPPNDEMPAWTVTGQTDTDCHIILDEAPEALDLNTFFIETPPVSLENVDDYETLKGYETDRMRLSVTSEDGLFMKARHSTNPELEELSEKEVLELLFEKNQSVSAQLVYCGQHEKHTESEMKQVIEMVSDCAEQIAESLN